VCLQISSFTDHTVCDATDAGRRGGVAVVSRHRRELTVPKCGPNPLFEWSGSGQGVGSGAHVTNDLNSS
jgi:hypothetical protein